jgi:Tfp pilus assembly protein PilX
MVRKLRAKLNRGTGDERGQVLILVLIFLLLGSLMVIPLLNFVSTGLKSGVVYENKANELYAADSGVNDATWQIKYDHLGTLFTSPAYSAYDYNTAWDYELSGQVNTEDVNVTIENVWVPQNIPIPTEAEASAIIEAEKLVVTNSSIGTSCKIKLTYSPEALEDLRVETLGIWLPPGFSYVEGSSNLEADPLEEYYAEPVIESHGGNQAVLWAFDSAPPFTSFPGVNPGDSPMVAEVTFQFISSQPLAKPASVAWITTSGVPDIPYSWDADVKVFKITSRADNSTVEAYIHTSPLYSAFFNNAITSRGDITIRPGTVVNGDVQYNGTLDNKGTIDGNIITAPIEDWPTADELSDFYWVDDVISGSSIDISSGTEENPYLIGPGHTSGNLTIKGSGVAALEGTLYVQGSLKFQTGTGIKLNGETIYRDYLC